MGEKRTQIYNALIEGASQGLSDKALYEFVQGRVPKASSKRLVRASLLALTDPHLKDRNILQTVYALAIKHRLDEGIDDDKDDEVDTVELTPEIREMVTSKPEKPAKSRKTKNDDHAAPA